jgi:hypothetical protein
MTLLGLVMLQTACAIGGITKAVRLVWPHVAASRLQRAYCDHTAEHAYGGPTTDENLGRLFRHHHGLKYEVGFRLHQPRPGHLRQGEP